MEDLLICNACQCEIRSAEERSTHYRSEWHRYNVKRRCADLQPISFDLFHEKLASLKSKQQLKNVDLSETVYCQYTKRTFKSQAAYEHFKSTVTYKKAVERHSSKSRSVDNGNEFADGVASSDVVSSEPDNDAASDQQKKIGRMTFDDEGEQRAGSASGSKMSASDAIPLKFSLFSRAGPFKSVKASLNYMLQNHGFFLPFVEFLVDLEGLLEYLGAKIGVGHVCIYCNRQFRSTEAVQQHMRDMGHSMIALTDSHGKEDEDLLEFWHFSHNILEGDGMDDSSGAEESSEDDDLEQTEDGVSFGEGKLPVDEQSEASSARTAVSSEGNGSSRVSAAIGRDHKARAPKLTREERQALLEEMRLRTLQLLDMAIPQVGSEDATPENFASASGNGSANGGDVRSLITVAAARKRQLREINTEGELVLTDGSIIGHRDYRRIYEQRPRPVTTSSKIQRMLLSQYYALKMPGYVAEARVKQHEKEKQNNAFQKKWMTRHLDQSIKFNKILKKYFRHQVPK